MPPLGPLESPPPGAKSWRGVANLDDGLTCTYYMADTDACARKKDKFIQDGPDNMIVISDFDRTISNHYYRQKDGSSITGQTAYSLLSDSHIMSEKFKSGMKAYHAKYFPLEFDPNISYEEKYKLMDEWWAASNGVLIEERPTLETLFDAVRYAKMTLRPGFSTAVQLANQQDIPIVVFSAGITQIIEEILRKLGSTNLLLPNVHVIANDLIVDENHVVTDFKQPLMHSLNKSQTSVRLVRETTHAWFEPYKNRKNVLLLGDNLGDANMSDGYEGDPDVCVMKVGFLNANEHALLEQYRRAFDIVVLNDGPMVPVATFIKDVIGPHEPKHDPSVVPEKK